MLQLFFVLGLQSNLTFQGIPMKVYYSIIFQVIRLRVSRNMSDPDLKRRNPIKDETAGYREEAASSSYRSRASSTSSDSGGPILFGFQNRYCPYLNHVYFQLVLCQYSCMDMVRGVGKSAILGECSRLLCNHTKHVKKSIDFHFYGGPRDEVPRSYQFFNKVLA